MAVLCLPGIASAHTGEFEKFNYCPSTTPGVIKCLHAVTNSGKIVLGNKTTPIVNPVTLQGGYGKAVEGFATFYGAVNGGETLSKTPQPVPGGLAGIVPPESAPLLIKILLALAFENGFTGVNATLELAEPASEIRLNNFNLTTGSSGTALQLPVRVHLENPFLGSSCYVGSSTNPIIWNLTTGTTSPPAPNEPITGKSGFISIIEEEEIVHDEGNELVDNSWAAPEATGCGEGLSLLVDPIIDLAVGLPASAGKNAAILQNTLDIATPGSVNAH
jgi:hypothetical protein